MYMDENMVSPMDRSGDGMMPHVAPEGAAPGTEGWGLKNYPLASVYAPLQSFRGLYDKDTALMKGTVFSELDLPFMGATVTKGGVGRG